MCLGTKTPCQFCGSPIEQKTTGRARLYCNDNCKDAYKYLSAFEDKFLKVSTMDGQSIKNIRSKLFSLANLTNGKKEK